MRLKKRLKEKPIKVDKVTFKPCSEKQKLMIVDEEVDLLILGGAAGSGKSYSMLLKAASRSERYKDSWITIIRDTYPNLKDLISKSKEIFPHAGAKYNINDKEWKFPNGAKVLFYSIPDDLQEMQGQERTSFFLDEAASFDEALIDMCFSRLRSATYKGKKQVVVSCNPDLGSWLFKFVEFSLDSLGVPRKGTENKIRYFCSVNSIKHFADSKEELIERFGKSTEVLSYRFIPATCLDNPPLLAGDKGYIGRLKSMSRVNVLRYLYGSWTAVPDEASLINKDKLTILPYYPSGIVRYVRAWDIAVSLPSEANGNDADWTVGVLIGKDREGNFYILDVVRKQLLVDKVIELIIETAQKDGELVDIIVPQDPAAAGKISRNFMNRAFLDAGVVVKWEPSNPHSSKLTRFRPVATLINNGVVSVIQGEWNTTFITELTIFNGERSTKQRKDDQVDATSSGFAHLIKSKQISEFIIDDFSRQNIKESLKI